MVLASSPWRCLGQSSFWYSGEQMDEITFRDLLRVRSGVAWYTFLMAVVLTSALVFLFTLPSPTHDAEPTTESVAKSDANLSGVLASIATTETQKGPATSAKTDQTYRTEESRRANDLLIFVIFGTVLAAGAVGGTLYNLRGLVAHPVRRDTSDVDRFDAEMALNYYLQPWTGAICGLIVLIGIKFFSSALGFETTPGKTFEVFADPWSRLSVTAMAVFAGFATAEFLEKIKELIKTLFSKMEVKEGGTVSASPPPANGSIGPKSTPPRSPKGLNHAFHLSLPNVATNSAGWALVVRNLMIGWHTYGIIASSSTLSVAQPAPGPGKLFANGLGIVFRKLATPFQYLSFEWEYGVAAGSLAFRFSESGPWITWTDDLSLTVGKTEVKSVKNNAVSGTRSGTISFQTTDPVVTTVYLRAEPATELVVWNVVSDDS